MIPNWTIGYPSIGTVTGTTAQFNVDIDVNGTAYFVVLPSGAIAPTSVQVKAGTDSSDIPLAAGFFGNVSLVANTPNLLTATNLISETDYDVYIVAEDTTPDLQLTPSILNITTSDITAPVWEATYPKSGIITGTTAEILVQTTENSTAYFVVVPNNATAPSAAQVKAGNDSTNTPVAVGFSGSVVLLANVESTLNILNLTSQTDYDVYVVAEDSVPNLQAAPVKIDLLTADITASTWIATYPKFGVIGGTTTQVLAEINENGTVYVVVVPNNATAPSAAQVKAGHDSTNTPVAVGFSGNVAVTANVEATLVISNLTSQTNYDVYVVAEDTSMNLQSLPVKLDLLTADVTNPTWTSTYPKEGTATTTTSTTVLVSTNEDATVYGIVLQKGSQVPTSQQVKAGTDANDVPVAIGSSGSTTTVASVETSLVFLNLFIGTDYDVYLVAEDASNNLQADPARVKVTTQSQIVGQRGIVEAQTGQIITVQIESLNILTSKDLSVFKMAVLPGTGYTIVQLGEREFQIKITSTDYNNLVFANVKVGDGIIASDTFQYKVKVVKAALPKEKPIAYGGTNVNPPTRRSYSSI